MRAKPGLAHLHAIKILHHDKLLAPRQLVPRHCASAHLPIFRYQDRFPATYQPCTATRVMLNKICTRTAKTRAIPSLHRDHFTAKVPGSARCFRRVTHPPHLAGPLGISNVAPAQMINKKYF